MKKWMIMAGMLATVAGSSAQTPLTPERLWELGRISAETVTPDGMHVLYGVSFFDLQKNASERNLYRIPLAGGVPQQITSTAGGESVVSIDAEGQSFIYLHKGHLWRKSFDKEDAVAFTTGEETYQNVRFAPDGKAILFTRTVPMQKVLGKERHEDLPLSDAYIFDDLNYRHWDSWFNGSFTHLFYAPYDNGKVGKAIDLLEGEPYDVPQQPFGGKEDFIWSPDGQSVLYVSKKKFGKSYAISTNTDIYQYDVQSGKTINLTEGMMGYDTHPLYSPDGQRLAWLSMAEDGYEADKNDLIVYDRKSSRRFNLTKAWDGTVSDYRWSNDGRSLYFNAAVNGTIQLFGIAIPTSLEKATFQVQQLSEGPFDVSSLVGQSGSKLVVSRNDINRAAELYTYDLQTKDFAPLTKVNDDAYSKIARSEVKGRTTKASDGKDLFSWVVYPPNFDPTKKYPTLLYCQGGPQSAVSQFYSFRWNLQLIAAQGYIVVAPNRRGMPGHGVEWNAAISGDWGGQPIRDYLSAIDDVAKEAYVDTDRLGAVGASYGGYSVFMLAGVHENRFKTFISHDGLFDLQSWYGTTEELFFANKDIGGAYWEPKAQKSYTEFNPIQYIDRWNTPIMIVQGGKDYRVGIEQGLEAFQVAQLKGIKSRLLYLPEENHWVLGAQNAIVWQREFFKWLKETL
jgi:dipeptidyl aminopeptidase/acylaminoacyl peptidase